MCKLKLYTVFILSFIFLDTSEGQELPDRNWHFRIPIETHIGVNWMRVSHEFGPRFIQDLGTYLNFNSGVSITRKENWGISVTGGGFLDNYTFSTDEESYDISVTQLRAQSMAFLLLPLSEIHETHLKIGMSGGFNFYTGDTLASSEGNLSTLAESSKRNAVFISPEIGISKRMKASRMNLSISYQYHVLKDSPHFDITLTTPNSKAVAFGFGDNLALKIGFQLGFKKRKRPTYPIPSINYEDRENDPIETIRTTRSFLRLKIWDSAEIDGDTISVIVNGKCVLSEYALEKEKLNLRINLQKNENVIYIIAHNEGRISPNTASCIVSINGRKKKLFFKTSLKENDVIRVFRN